jgi:WD40 repeat protein/mono/diheme cytochrome c family protein
MKALLCTMVLLGFSLTVLARPARAQSDGPTPAVKAQAVLKKHCAQCHGDNGTKKGGMNYILDQGQLVERGQVIPGDPASSPLFQRIAKDEMPPAKQPRPSAEEIAVLRQWVEDRASFSAVAGKRPFVSEAAVNATIRADLEARAPKQQRFARYFTVAHLANAGRDATEIATARLALGKLLNSLSWHPRLTLPAGLGNGVYRIDLRDYKWAPASWERLLREYPYKSAPADEDSKLLARWTGTDMPAIRADWFIATASRPPLYHDLLQLPNSDRGLERLLQVDVIQDLQDESAVRAGFNNSGVSKNNRIIERHDAVYGAYWRSYDFNDNKGRQSVFEHPLGPTNGETSFKQAGGEMIFHLPNGLHGYLIVDAQGRRIDKAPVEIVSDPQRPDQRVETGLSCMSCHARGFLPKADQVRAHVVKNKKAFAGAAVDAVVALYPHKEAMQKLVDEDNARYGKAVHKLGLTLEDEDPVNLVARRYEAALDVALTAAETGVDVERFRKMLGDYPSVAKALGTLAVKGGTVQRDVFEDNFPVLSAFAAQASGRRPGSTTGSPTWFDEPIRKGSVYEAASGSGTTHCLALSADGKRGAAGRNENELAVFDADSGKVLLALAGHKKEVSAVAFSPQATWLASAGADRTVRTWDLKSGEAKQKLTGHSDRIRCLAFSPDGWYLVSGGDDRSVRLWQHLGGKEVRCLMGHDGPVLAVAWAPDGKWFVSAGQDGTLRRWETSTGKELAVFQGHSGAVHAVAVSPDGTAILSGGADKTVRLWDVATGKEQKQLTGHVNSVIAVAFSADRKKALSASSQYRQTDALVRLWDLSTGKEDQRWAEDPSGTVGCAALAPAAGVVVTGGTSAAVKHWQVVK